MFPEYPRFEPIRLEHEDCFLRLASQHRPSSCELNFANLFIWQELDGSLLTMIDGQLCIKINLPNEDPFYLEPIGSGDMARALDICFQETGRLSRVEEQAVELMRRGRRVVVTPQREHFDYLYVTEKLATLPGRRYHGKRNHIRAFEGTYPAYGSQPLDEAYTSQMMDVFERWYALKSADATVQSDPLSALAFAGQRRALEKALTHFQKLGLRGHGIFLQEQLLAFLIASPLSEETVCVHFLYCLPGFRGLIQTALREACRVTLRDFAFVNLEQDLGLAGLRRFKESYYPERLVEKFDVRLLPRS